MSILTSYLLKKFLKNFIIILLSLEIFFVGIDLMQHIKGLPDSANLQFLYILYNSFFILTITLPLSLVFGWIITIVHTIRNNELVIFLSLGTPYSSIYSPIVKASILIIFILISLQVTPLAYSYEQKSKILHGTYFTNTKTDLFLKYNEYFVYFKKLYPIEKRAEDIHIFKIEDNDVSQSITAKKAYFQNNKWYVVDATIIRKPHNINWDSSKLLITHEKFLNTLEGFKPKILDNVYEAKSQFSIIDAIYALVLLSNQKINTDKIKAALYYQTVTAFFAVALIILIFIYAPISNRFFNMGQFVSLSIFGTLVTWGALFILYKLSLGGIIAPEISILLPIAILYLITFVRYKQRVR